MYWCFSGKCFKFNEITNIYHNVCRNCYNSMMDNRSNDDNQNFDDLKQETYLIDNDDHDTFIYVKLKSQIQYIKNVVVPQLTLNNENKDADNDHDADKVADNEHLNKYLQYLYCFLYQGFILKFKDKINDDIYQKLIAEWNEFYNPAGIVYKRKANCETLVGIKSGFEFVVYDNYEETYWRTRTCYCNKCMLCKWSECETFGKYYPCWHSHTIKHDDRKIWALTNREYKQREIETLQRRGRVRQRENIDTNVNDRSRSRSR